MRYAEFTTDISTRNVIRMHLNAFRHFEGLLKALRDQNVENFQTRVEKRDLSEYEEVM